MTYGITCSTKILTLAIVLFFFILFGTLCEFAMVSIAYILLSSQEGEKCSVLPEGTDVRIQQHIHQKNLNLCQTSYYYAKVIVKLKNALTRN